MSQEDLDTLRQAADKVDALDGELWHELSDWLRAVVVSVAPGVEPDWRAGSEAYHARRIARCILHEPSWSHGLGLEEPAIEVKRTPRLCSPRIGPGPGRAW